MNIFYLHTEPSMAARYHCDKHVVKMILETAQMLSSAHHVWGSPHAECVYKAAYLPHPSTKWVASGKAQYQWAYLLFLDLLHEYECRYDKTHASDRLREFLGDNPVGEDIEFTPPPQCMPDEYKHDCTVTAYRNYYIGEKAYFARWDRLEQYFIKSGQKNSYIPFCPPHWWPINNVNKEVA